jgi:hypothetical protein
MLTPMKSMSAASAASVQSKIGNSAIAIRIVVKLPV